MNGNTMDETLSTAIIIVYSIAVVVCCVAIIAGVWKMFEKAGEGGWKSFIPIYNMYILYKIAWGNGWLFLLCFIPVVNIVVSLIFMWKLNAAFGKGVGFFILTLFFPYIAYLILGFGSDDYIGPQ